MTRLPVIIGHGGVNAAGRISGHHAYRRMVINALSERDRSQTYAALAALMNHTGDSTSAEVRAYIDAHTLIRRIEAFDPEQVYQQRSAELIPDGVPLSFTLTKRQLPTTVPESWSVRALDDKTVAVTVDGTLPTLLPDYRNLGVSAAGQVPTGFEPGTLYPSRSHPRGLHLTVYGASDALQSSGISVDALKAAVRPDEFAVYSGSAQGQLDDESMGGLCSFPMRGKRTTSKHISMSLAEMPGDFVNAYVLGSVGSTGAVIGACATYLYNVQQAVHDITAGRRRVALVGNAEAPVLPHVIEAYRVMGALTEDSDLLEMDGGDAPDWRRACRPFSTNAGFTVAEGSAFTLLVDDELALELGANILGSVPGVFVNADGFKKSISGPGVGNYITVGKAMALTRSLLGEDGLRERSYVHAHGTGTPQNRVTESHILSSLASQFGIEHWPVTAIKAYVGHTMAPAGGDAAAAALGSWQYGWLPGIDTIDHLADDVHTDGLDFQLRHAEHAPDRFDATLINSKGFGGNNATGVMLSPQRTLAMLKARHGQRSIDAHASRNESIREASERYEAACLDGSAKPIYHFGEGVIDSEELSLSAHSINVPGFDRAIELGVDNPFADMS